MQRLVTWPISKILDWALGNELGTIYSNKELQKLVDIHTTRASVLEKDTADILKGALRLQEERVFQVMKKWEHVYKLKDTDALDFRMVTEIFRTGFY